MSKPNDAPRFVIPLPGGRVARIPLAELEKHVAAGTRCAHGVADAGHEVEAQEMSVDAQSGQSYWHTDWEYGQCTYTDDSGFPRNDYCWHRHPLGNEYTEVMQ